MKKLFGFGSSTPPPPAVPTRPPAPPAKHTPTPKPAPAKAEAALVDGRSIVGRWKEPGGSDTTEFHADGSVTERSGGETIRGKYVLVGSNLKINLEGVTEALTFSATIDHDTLEMIDGDGQATKYARA